MSASPAEISSMEQLTDVINASYIVIVNFYSESSEASHQVAGHFETLAQAMAPTIAVKLVQVNHDISRDISQKYGVTCVPTFLIFRMASVFQRVEGTDPRELYTVVKQLATDIETQAKTFESQIKSAGTWKGAELPRSYGDITDQVETRNCELLNADEDAGHVKVLFEKIKPSALGSGKESSKDWVQSGVDDQLILFIPFQSSIKLHTLQLTSLPPPYENDAPSRPEVIHLYINRTQNIDFDEADDIEPTQAIALTGKDWNVNGTANISLQFVKFQKTTTLIIYVQKGVDGADAVRLDRVRLIGEAGAKREMGKLEKVAEDE